jgi:hypothetical protein
LIASCWSFMITQTAANVLLGLSIVLHPLSCKKYVANLFCSKLPACILQVDICENVHYVAKMSYYKNEQGTTYGKEKDDLNAMFI